MAKYQCPECGAEILTAFQNDDPPPLFCTGPGHELTDMELVNTRIFAATEE